MIKDNIFLEKYKTNTRQEKMREENRTYPADSKLTKDNGNYHVTGLNDLFVKDYCSEIYGLRKNSSY